MDKQAETGCYDWNADRRRLERFKFLLELDAPKYLINKEQLQWLTEMAGRAFTLDKEADLLAAAFGETIKSESVSAIRRSFKLAIERSAEAENADMSRADLVKYV